jgi:hypothetical protein
VEAFRLGIFNPGFSAADLDDFLSRKNTTRLQESLNPPVLAPLFKNKAIFYQLFRIHGLPIPRLYGLFSGLGKTTHICMDEMPAALVDIEALADSLPARFAVKPVEGAYGKGFRIINRLSADFVDHNGVVYPLKQFPALLAATSGIGTLIQEVVENHSAITSFSGVSGLQTIRLITLVGAEGKVEILGAFFKTITSPSIVIDTFLDALKGNVEVAIDVADGALVQACVLDGTGREIVVLNHHPVSQKPFQGFIIPCWSEVCELARRAAIAALPARTIGWDIAVTPRGVCLIEGNVWWDPPNQHRVMGHIAKKMKAAIADFSHDSSFL